MIDHGNVPMMEIAMGETAKDRRLDRLSRKLQAVKGLLAREVEHEGDGNPEYVTELINLDQQIDRPALFCSGRY
jgi:hypothetical protein